MTRFAFIIGLAYVLTSGCSNDSHPGVGSQTHWLSACEKDGSCGGSLSCICGVCIAACTKDSSCSVPGRDTECVGANATPARALCEQPAPKPICLESCTADSCPNGQNCVSGVCLPKANSAKDAGTDAGRCADVPMCEFVCPDGKINPVDSNGCVHTCECVDVDAGTGALQWFTTCGDPVCGISPDPFDDPSIAGNCTTEKEGQTCTTKDARCDGVASCGATLICTDSDPTAGPGGCPISRARFKQDIVYLTQAELHAYRDQVLSMPLASYRYRKAPEGGPQLGFIIEDVEPSVAVSGDHVNMYGYLSMAVAAIQVQQAQIHALEAEVEAMRAQVAERDPAPLCAPQRGLPDVD